MGGIIVSWEASKANNKRQPAVLKFSDIFHNAETKIFTSLLTICAIFAIFWDIQPSFSRRKALSPKFESSKHTDSSMSSFPSPYSTKSSASVEIPHPATAEDVTKMFLILNQTDSLNRGKISTVMSSRWIFPTRIKNRSSLPHQEPVSYRIWTVLKIRPTQRIRWTQLL